MKVYVIMASFRNLNDWVSECVVGDVVFSTHEEAKVNAFKMLTDHIHKSTRGITLPEDISFEQLRDLAQEEEPEDYPNAIVYWTCDLAIIERKLKTSPKYTRNRVGDKWYHYRVEMTPVSKKISKAEYEKNKK